MIKDPCFITVISIKSDIRKYLTSLWSSLEPSDNAIFDKDHIVWIQIVRISEEKVGLGITGDS